MSPREILPPCYVIAAYEQATPDETPVFVGYVLRASTGPDSFPSEIEVTRELGESIWFASEGVACFFLEQLDPGPGMQFTVRRVEPSACVRPE